MSRLQRISHKGPAPRDVMERIAARSIYREQGYVTPCRVWWPVPKTLHGYAATSVGSRADGSLVAKGVHIHVWEHYNGPLPVGRVIDHLCCDRRWCAGGDDCPHRACSEILHLGLSTIAENVMRGNGICARNALKTHCIRGHEFTPENTYWHTNPNGRPMRNCRACTALRTRERRERLRCDA